MPVNEPLNPESDFGTRYALLPAAAAAAAAACNNLVFRGLLQKKLAAVLVMVDVTFICASDFSALVRDVLRALRAPVRAAAEATDAD